MMKFLYAVLRILELAGTATIISEPALVPSLGDLFHNTNCQVGPLNLIPRLPPPNKRLMYIAAP
jgi:hypothetical protein